MQLSDQETEEQSAKPKRRKLWIVGILVFFVVLAVSVGICRYINRDNPVLDIATLQEMFPKGASVYGIHVVAYLAGYETRSCGQDLQYVCFDKHFNHIKEGDGRRWRIVFIVTYDDKDRVIKIESQKWYSSSGAIQPLPRQEIDTERFLGDDPKWR